MGRDSGGNAVACPNPKLQVILEMGRVSRMSCIVDSRWKRLTPMLTPPPSSTPTPVHWPSGQARTLVLRILT